MAKEPQPLYSPPPSTIGGEPEYRVVRRKVECGGGPRTYWAARYGAQRRRRFLLWSFWMLAPHAEWRDTPLRAWDDVEADKARRQGEAGAAREFYSRAACEAAEPRRPAPPTPTKPPAKG